MKSTCFPQDKFTVILRKEEGGGYSVQCVELPGAISEGKTKKEALSNIREAIQGFLEAFPEEEVSSEVEGRSRPGYNLKSSTTLLSIIEQSEMTREEFLRLLD